jgi:Zinc finger, C3HC4 type (RING finger)
METMEDAAVLKADSRFSCNICLDPVIEPVVTRCGHLFCWPCLFRWLEPGIRPEEALPTWDLPARPVDESRRCCPVCKAPSSVPTLVPIYVRNEPNTPLGSTKKEPEENETANEEAKEESKGESPDSSREEDSTGLRQRLRFRSRDSDIPNTSFNDDVPSRPAAVTPPRTSSAVAHRQQAPYIPPRSPQPSLSHGMLLLFQQALENPQQRTRVPPLHRNPGEEFNTTGTLQSPRDDATEFLSRLLLILASFVILCLLLF